jgi:3',5'-cyclic AMP phosphodiesterase CpdA
VTVRLLQVSDLHVGAHDDGRSEVEEALRRQVAALEPELVIASGDLTHRNHREQHARAGAFLRSLDRPLLALPGNHDLPALPPARVAAPYKAFLGVWPEIEPVYRSEGLVVCGLNSVRPWKYQRGALADRQLERAASVFAAASASALRVVALHHHLLGAPWRTGKRSIPARSHVLKGLASAGAELVVSGHIHQSVVVERREFVFTGGAARGLVLAVAPGLGRPRPSRHAEASGFQLYEADPARVRVLTHAWCDGRFDLVADRTFPRGEAALPGS